MTTLLHKPVMWRCVARCVARRRSDRAPDRGAGAEGSVTGAGGSVAGAEASVTGAEGSGTGAGGSVAGAEASVTGAGGSGAGAGGSVAGAEGSGAVTGGSGFARRQHTEAGDEVEVELKRLQGEDEGVVEVRMRRHKARNALGHVFVSQMRELVSSLSTDTAARVVVFRSLVPRVFSAGADLKERAIMNHSESDLFVHGLRSLMTQIAVLPAPTIAAIDGVALGGGLELALACDLRIAACCAHMGLIETTRGLLPGAGGSQRLPRIIGVTLAKELIFTGRRVDGRAALEMGLVNRAVEQNADEDAAYREALGLAREILPQAPIAVRMAKEAMNRGVEVDMTSAMAIERMCYARVIPTRDRQEGMAAFIEKRPPRYIGE